MELNLNTTMKIKPITIYNSSLGSLCAVVFGIIMINTAHAQPEIFIDNMGTSSVGEYNLDGSVVNASLIQGVSAPMGLTISGSDIFVASSTGVIGKYSINGSTVNSSLISGFYSAQATAVSGSNLFVAAWTSSSTGQIGEYNLDGTTVNASLISGIASPFGIQIYGSHMYVEENFSTVAEYNLDGTPVNTSLITGLSWGTQVLESGSYLYVVDRGAGTVREYNLGWNASQNTDLGAGCRL